MEALAGFIVPTRVGVNRRCRSSRPQAAHCPHARGGEPFAVEI